MATVLLMDEADFLMIQSLIYAFFLCEILDGFTCSCLILQSKQFEKGNSLLDSTTQLTNTQPVTLTPKEP